VGRLDVNTTGALLVTNDGLLCYRLTHPKFEVPRTYVARVRGHADDRSIARMRRMAGTGERAGVERMRTLGKVSVLKITLTEGRNRQVRRMCEAVGLRVVKLKRVSFGPVSVRKLPLGAVRPLERRELERLRRITSSGREES
jgi:pseudouridine synthase